MIAEPACRIHAGVRGSIRIPGPVKHHPLFVSHAVQARLSGGKRIDFALRRDRQGGRPGGDTPQRPQAMDPAQLGRTVPGIRIQPQQIQDNFLLFGRRDIGVIAQALQILPGIDVIGVEANGLPKIILGLGPALLLTEISHQVLYPGIVGHLLQ